MKGLHKNEHKHQHCLEQTEFRAVLAGLLLEVEDEADLRGAGGITRHPVLLGRALEQVREHSELHVGLEETWMEAIKEVNDEMEYMKRETEEDTLKGVTEEQTVEGEAAEARGRPAAEGEQASTCVAQGSQE